MQFSPPSFGLPGGTVTPQVAIQGELGSFSHEAARSLAPLAKVVPCMLSGDVFASLMAGEVDMAVIPIENSLAGSVLEHYDLLLAHDVRIEEESLLRVRHNLIARPGERLAGLSLVYSHPIALDQCRGFFRQHPHLQPTPFYDTAGSVKHVVGGGAGLHVGAIASRQAAEQYGGVLLAEGIEDNSENYTRFFLIRPSAGSRRTAWQPQAEPGDSAVEASTVDVAGAESWRASESSNANKVSLCFAVENRPGSLVAVLEIFARQQTNLTRLESRPVPGSPWQYIFYADYQMDDASQADTALAQLVQHCSMVKELGRYTAAVRPGR